MSEPNALAPAEDIRTALTKMAPEFKAALPAHITPERFIRIAVTAIRTNPDIAKCSRPSIYSALMRCAQDGLLPDGRDATITKYGDQAVYSPMVGGICKRARNSGELKSIDAQVVYEKDSYESWTDEKGPHFKHVRSRGDRGKPILTYAYAATNVGGFYFEEIDEGQMADIESASRAKTGPWKGAFRDEMKRKSAIRRLAKYRLPSSADLDEMIRRDDHLFDLEGRKAAEDKAREISQAIRDQATKAIETQPPVVVEEPGSDG